MPFRLKAGEPVPEGLKNIVVEEIESASEQLTGASNGKDRAEAIHEARKSVKKIRSVLRLVRDELGDVYDAENKRLQSVGRRLSAFRDGAAVIEVFDGLTEKYKDELDGHDLASVRTALVARRDEAEQAPELARVLRDALTTLRYVGKKTRTWPVKTDGFGGIAPGLERTYRQGRRALAVARKEPRPENYHQLRKRVKDHWYHVRLLEDLWTTVLQGYERSLKNLETWLGDDHNLVLLRDKIAAEPASFGAPADTDFLIGLIGKYQKELRDNSLSLGERVYEEKPKEFRKRMKHLWRAWETQPKSLAGVQKVEREEAKSQKAPEPEPEVQRARAAGHRHGTPRPPRTQS